MNHSSRMSSNCFLIVAACVLMPAFSACGARSMSDGSTDTGNPPVIDEQAITVTEDGPNVIVRGAAGAVTGEAEVTVSNLKSGAKNQVTAKADGSFQIELPGSAADEYEVEVVANGKRTRVKLEPATLPKNNRSDAGPVTPSERVDPDAGPATPAAVEKPASGGVELVGKQYGLQTAAGITPVKLIETPVKVVDYYSFWDTPVQLHFSSSAAFGFTMKTCQSFDGSYTICEGDKLCVGNSGSISNNGCGTDWNDQDQWVLDFFRSKPTLKQTGYRLSVIGADATLEFLDLEGYPDTPLVGGQWTVINVITGDSESTPLLVPENVPTIVFNEDATVQVFFRCNSGQGRFEEAGGELTFSQVSFTKIACPDTDASVEAGVKEVIADGVTTFEIDGPGLTLMRGANGIRARTY